MFGRPIIFVFENKKQATYEKFGFHITFNKRLKSIRAIWPILTSFSLLGRVQVMFGEKRPGGPLTALHERVALKEPSVPIPCEKHLAITFTNERKMWPCCNKSLATRRHPSHSDILGSQMT